MGMKYFTVFTFAFMIYSIRWSLGRFPPVDVEAWPERLKEAPYISTALV